MAYYGSGNVPDNIFEEYESMRLQGMARKITISTLAKKYKCSGYLMEKRIVAQTKGKSFYYKNDKGFELLRDFEPTTDMMLIIIINEADTYEIGINQAADLLNRDKQSLRDRYKYLVNSGEAEEIHKGLMKESLVYKRRMKVKEKVG